METDKAALEGFVIENDDLDRLEDLLQEVNIFEAIGATRSEQRHSDFLAFLLDPTNPHGLGDLFLRRLLQRCLMLGDKSNRGGLSPIELDTCDLNDTLVFRERDNIDILIINERLEMAFVIENKISTKEHSNQLVRYREQVARQFPKCRTCHLYLSPGDDDPTDLAYIRINYYLVVEILERIMSARSDNLGGDARVLIRHYIQMIRRNLLEDSEVSELARAIYAKHRHALDLIFEHRPDMVTELNAFVRGHVEGAGLPLDHCIKTHIRFYAPEWEPIRALRNDTQFEWTKTGRILLFEVKIIDTVKIFLYVGPGSSAVREKLWSMAKSIGLPFKAGETLYSKWTQVYSKTVLTKADMATGDLDELKQKFVKSWDEFLQHDFPKIRDAVVSAMKDPTS